MNKRRSAPYPFRPTWPRRLAVIALLGLGLATGGCDGSMAILVRLTTIVHADGGLTRSLAVDAFLSEENSKDEKWIRDTFRLSVAEPRAWDHVHEQTGRLRAEGFFASADMLPPMLAFDLDGARKTDRVRTTLTIEERTVMRRWVYHERHGDLFGDEEIQQAIDGIALLIEELLRSEIPREMGEDIDMSHVEDFVHGELRDLVAALLDAGRREASRHLVDRGDDLKAQVLVDRGIAVREVDEDDDFLEAHWPAMERWTLSHLVDALAASGVRVESEALRFWPRMGGDDEDEDEGEDGKMWWNETVERVWGSEEAFMDRIDPLIAALSGYFEAGGAREYRFECRVRLPGVLLETNGTPEGQDAVWLLRDADLTRDHFLDARSVEVIDDPLRRLGARRSFETGELIQLHDLLWNRDPAGILDELLASAVAAGDLELLRDGDAIPSGYGTRSRELADLLDPDFAPPERF